MLCNAISDNRGSDLLTPAAHWRGQAVAWTVPHSPELPSDCITYVNKYSYLSISSYPKGYQMLPKAVIYIGDNEFSS